jgi:DNA replication protein DnaC
VADEAGLFAHAFIRRGEGMNPRVLKKHMVLCGQPGTGKTRVAEKLNRWCSNAAVQLGEPYKGRFLCVGWVEFASVAFIPIEEFRIWLDGEHETDLLFLEDIGAEVDRFKTGEPTERLREILNEFKHRWLFITTNVMPDHWPAKWDERIADRLLRDSKVIPLWNTKRFTNKS